MYSFRKGKEEDKHLKIICSLFEISDFNLKKAKR